MLLICENIRIYDSYDPFGGSDIATEIYSPITLVSTENEAKKFIAVMELLGGGSRHDFVIQKVEPGSYHVVLYNGKIHRMFKSYTDAVDWVASKKRKYEILPLEYVEISISEIELTYA